MKTWISITLLACVCFFQKGDASVDSWTTPSGGSGSTTVAESAATGATVYTVAAVIGGGASISAYTLVTTGSPFTMATGTSGVLTLTATGTIDYESNPTYVLTIQATDDSSATGTATLTVSVTNAATDPTFSAITYNLCVPTGTVVSTSVYTLTATDPDGDTLTYSIGGGNTNTDFSIASGTGVISTANAITATTGTYSLIINAADATLSATATISATVQAVCSSATALVVSGLAILTSLVVSLH